MTVLEELERWYIAVLDVVEEVAGQLDSDTAQDVRDFIESLEVYAARHICGRKGGALGCVAQGCTSPPLDVVEIIVSGFLLLLLAVDTSIF